MSAVIIDAIVFACLFAAALIRMLLHMRLPIHPLDLESKERAQRLKPRIHHSSIQLLPIRHAQYTCGVQPAQIAA
ncbi:hypothetical protein PFAS1_24525 [Pseudomonas frederiksbergensis]|nr:hypothetical protein PFAS1_24525 [Pseudomonas frederiksbergensis]